MDFFGSDEIFTIGAKGLPLLKPREKREREIQIRNIGINVITKAKSLGRKKRKRQIPKAA